MSICCVILFPYQVRQDVWQGRLPASVAVVSPIKSTKSRPESVFRRMSPMGSQTSQGSQGSQVNMSLSVDVKNLSASYDWLTRLLNHYFGTYI